MNNTSATNFFFFFFFFLRKSYDYATKFWRTWTVSQELQFQILSSVLALVPVSANFQKDELEALLQTTKGFMKQIYVKNS